MSKDREDITKLHSLSNAKMFDDYVKEFLKPAMAAAIERNMCMCCALEALTRTTMANLALREGVDSLTSLLVLAEQVALDVNRSIQMGTYEIEPATVKSKMI